jgi:hypothetical protein
MILSLLFGAFMHSIINRFEKILKAIIYEPEIYFIGKGVVVND